MSEQSGLHRSNEERTRDAREKAIKAIDELKEAKEQVNFSSVSKKSGVSRPFLYRDQEIRNIIEEQRRCDVKSEMNRRARFDRTARSKDVIIAAKDKRIAKLEKENTQLKKELSILRGMIYGTSKPTSDTCN